MSVRENRDQDFWGAIFAHPEVHARVTLGGEVDLPEILSNPRILPLATEHGGFLFCELDGLARTFELHTMFTPEGWGREVHGAAKDAFEQVFLGGAELIVTHQVASNARSQPPRSFGFMPTGDFRASSLGEELRTWVLTRAAWEASTARMRMQ